MDIFAISTMFLEKILNVISQNNDRQHNNTQHNITTLSLYADGCDTERHNAEYAECYGAVFKTRR
jgi:hypothetical protein